MSQRTTASPWRAWSAQEDECLRALYPTTSTAAIAAQLGRSPRAVRMRASQLGARKTDDYRSDTPALNTWTPQELAYLRAHYPDGTTADIAAALGRTERAVHHRACMMGIAKSEAFFASFRSGRIHAIRTDPRMIATRFKPGHQTWNKGRPWVEQHPNSVATRFRKGNRPTKEAPIGSYRINKSKGQPRLECKVTDTPGPNNRRWVPVTRLVWEAAHGPVPPGHIVVFDPPGAASLVLEEITLDKIKCISRAEHARRNHPANAGPEMARLYQLKGAITRQVNRIAREAGNQPQEPKEPKKARA